jgi:glycosyltransferase involved in cell wall biosynthesis
MNIAMLTAVYPPYAAGMAVVAQMHVEILRSAGHQVRVFTPFVDGEDVIQLPSVVRFGNAAYIPHLDDIAKFQPDILIVEYPFIDCIRALRDFHTRYPDVEIKIYYHMDLRASGLKGIIFDDYTRRALRFFKEGGFSIAVSSREYGLASDLVKFGLLASAVVPLGVDDTVFVLGSSDVLRERCGVEDDQTIVLFVGSLDSAHQFKGLELLLQVFVEVQGHHLAVVGKGNLKEMYQKKAETLGISQRVHWLGFVSDEELPHIYQGADVCILPSTMRSEAFGLVLVEAQLSGTPVIASALPGVSGVVDPVSGVLFEVGNEGKLVEILVKFQKKRVPHQGARTFAQQYSRRVTDNAFLVWATTIYSGKNSLLSP